MLGVVEGPITVAGPGLGTRPGTNGSGPGIGGGSGSEAPGIAIADAGVPAVDGS